MFKELEVYFSDEYKKILERVGCEFELIYDRLNNFGSNELAFTIFNEYLNIDIKQHKDVLNINNYLADNYIVVSGKEAINQYLICEKRGAYILHQSVSHNPLDYDCLKILKIQNLDSLTYDVLQELHEYFQDCYIFIKKSKKVFFITHDLVDDNFRYILNFKG
jgi:hypothetical protein